MPLEDAQDIMYERFPMPRFYVSTPGDTNERKFKVKLNPSGQPAGQQEDKDKYYTEDVSLAVFMQHLIQKAVTS